MGLSTLHNCCASCKLDFLKLNLDFKSCFLFSKFSCYHCMWNYFSSLLPWSFVNWKSWYWCQDTWHAKLISWNRTMALYNRFYFVSKKVSFKISIALLLFGNFLFILFLLTTGFSMLKLLCNLELTYWFNPVMFKFKLILLQIKSI